MAFNADKCFVIRARGEHKYKQIATSKTFFFSPAPSEVGTTSRQQ
jgi:hypothetical protein